MALTMTIGSSSFAALANSAARCALHFSAGAPSYPTVRHKTPGVDGHRLTRLGFSGRRLTLRVRYGASSLSAMYALYNADLSSWSNTLVTIVGGDGASYLQCALESASPSAGPAPASSSWVFMDVEYVFAQEALA